ncbi:MAG: DUF305 domain-containing protein [Ignavibacteriaceae bacterium]
MEQGVNNHYTRLFIMVAVHFIAMYALMYSMVNVFDNLFHNFNQFYMAGLMTASMGVIEIALMGSMYYNKKLNAFIAGVSIVALAAFFIFIRQQTAVSDIQFVRSMIPHHSGAILMCEEASITDPELKKLCEEIIANQQAEISQMKVILSRLEK